MRSVVRSVGSAPSLGNFCVKACVGIAERHAASSSTPSIEGGFAVRTATRWTRPSANRPTLTSALGAALVDALEKLVEVFARETGRFGGALHVVVVALHQARDVCALEM